MRWLVLLFLGFFCSFCGPNDPTPTIPANELARFAGGTITVDEFESALLQLPASMASQKTAPTEALKKEILRNLAVEKILLAEGHKAAIEQSPEFQKIDHQLKRTFFAQRYIQAHGKFKEATPEHLQSFFEENRDTYRTQPTRHVFHLFRRITPEQPEAEQLAQIQALRTRAIQGENWATLARDHSHSESRHRGGDLGQIVKGSLSEDFDKHIFNLEKGVPSQPIRTAEGYHLFLVQSALEEQRFEQEEVQPQLMNDFLQNQLRQVRNDLAEALPLAENAFRVEPEALRSALFLGSPNYVLLRQGSYQLTQKEFKELLEKIPDQTQANLAANLFQEIWDQERIYQHLMGNEALDLQDPVYLRLRRQQLIEHIAKWKLRQDLEADSQRLQDHFEKNRMRYASALRIQLLRFTEDLGQNPNKQMARLEALKEQFDKQAITFDKQHLPEGVIQSLPLMDLGSLQKRDPRAPLFAVSLKERQASPPYRWKNKLIMLYMRKRMEPEEQPFDAVLPQVLNEYLSQNLQGLYAELKSTLLAENDFSIHDTSPSS